ncbi:MAG: GNAT family N-acetyltransferase [Hyphomicrobiaceae bacterium]
MPISIVLLPLDARLAAALAVGNFAALHGRAVNTPDIADDLCAVAEEHRNLYSRTGAEAPWIGYLAQGTGHHVVGACGFKDRCRDGSVEIAYVTFPAHQRRGYGTAMTASLLNIALAQDDVREIRAHTLPAENASTIILRRAGFALTGPVHDPEDGEVWRWCFTRTAGRA